ncbi:electron transfer flavoprotein subunit alpha/FixB family protein [bacterium]|nr:electron transfer flavoprotein subunit alpha/FixB family protein [bacterium]
MAGTLIVAEVTNEGKSRKISYELIGAARAIDGDFAAIIFGKGAKDAAGELGSRGASKVYVVDDPALNTAASRSFAESVKKAIEAEGAGIVLFGFTSFGRDISGRLAAKLDAGLLDDVTAFEKEDDGRIIATKPLYAGKIISKCRLRGDGIQLFSIRPNNFPAADAGDGSCEIVEMQFDASSDSAVTKELRPKEAGMVDLIEAEIIISGGRGLKDADGFKPLRKMAERFGWAMGSSRAMVDAGHIEHSYQVGQTGKTVNPKLYIACGISGAIQHLAGMQTSKVIVAINNDPEAPIFQVADYGIVGDLFEIVPLLEEELAKALA